MQSQATSLLALTKREQRDTKNAVGTVTDYIDIKSSFAASATSLTKDIGQINNRKTVKNPFKRKEELDRGGLDSKRYLSEDKNGLK